MILLQNFIDFLFVVGFCMGCKLLLFQNFCTNLAFYFFLVTVCLVFLDILEFPHVEAVTAFNRSVIDFLSERRVLDYELFNSAKRTFGFLVSLFGLINDILMASLAEEFFAFGLNALNSLAGDSIADAAIEIILLHHNNKI